MLYYRKQQLVGISQWESKLMLLNSIGAAVLDGEEVYQISMGR